MRILILSLMAFSLFSADYQLKCRNSPFVLETKSLNGNGSFSVKANSAQVELCNNELEVRKVGTNIAQNYTPGSPYCSAEVSNDCDLTAVTKNNRVRGKNNVTGTCTGGTTGACTASCDLQTGNWTNIDTSSCVAATCDKNYLATGSCDAYKVSQTACTAKSFTPDGYCWPILVGPGRQCCSDQECSGVCEAITRTITYSVPGSAPEECKRCDGVQSGVPCGIECDCFIQGTMITMADGSLMPVENIQVGDLLLGSNDNINKVLKLKHNFKRDALIYSINGSEYFVTEGHPFMTAKGWKAFNAKTARIINPTLEINILEIGDILITEEGYEKVETIDFKATTEMVYNFELDGSKDYFADGFLVHNK